MRWPNSAGQRAGILPTARCNAIYSNRDRVKPPGCSRFLSRHFPDITPQQVITVGDSPNDESLFDRARFPHGVGVANLKDYWPQLTHRPTYVANAAEVDGFLELVDVLLGKG